MKHFMAIVIVPLGCADKVVRAANEAGATGATIIRARGADDSASKGVLGFHIEMEEEIVLITATQKIAEAVCKRIHDEFIKNSTRGSSIYILPVQRGDVVNAE